MYIEMFDSREVPVGLTVYSVWRNGNSMQRGRILDI